MNYKNPKKQKNFKEAVKCLVALCVLSLGLASIFYSKDTFSDPLPYCDTIVTPATPQPGVNCTNRDCALVSGTAKPGLNCLFYSTPLPLCQTVPSAGDPINGAGYAIAASQILTAGVVAKHRANCADLSDLPLCSDIRTINPLPGKNCVNDCNSANFTNPDTSHTPAYVRGTDYAVHNRDCVRFCDAVTAENTAFTTTIVANSGVNCIGRQCHQMPSGTAPSPTVSPVNCTSIPCNLLTTSELNKVATALSGLVNPPNNYCKGDTDINGDILKCYKFTKSQLPYLIVGPMCQIHDCKPTSTTCGADDTLNITSNTEVGYATDYVTYINAGYSLSGTDATICTPVMCKPTVNRTYRCTPAENTSPTTRNTNCDTTGAGATCASGYCYKTIDCNLTANASEAECITASPSEDGTVGSTEDTMDSWFYRPVPMSKSYVSSSGILYPMGSGSDGEDLCYTQSQLDGNDEGHDWGYHPKIHIHFTIPVINYTVDFWIDLGYYHSYLLPDSTRSPGKCKQSSYDRKDGYRGTGYIYLCGNGGNLYSNVNDYTAYHKGYVQTEFFNADATHKLNVCLRFKNSMRPDDGTSETCGARECGISCAFDICTSQVCGSDVCRELTVTDSDPYQCRMNSELFTNDNAGRGCQAVIDTYLRIRAVKYTGNRICTFLDVKGQLAYPESNPLNFYTGSETLIGGECVSGTTTATGCSGGKNTKDDRGEATRWRTLLRIPYIKNNRPSTTSVRGYLDKSLQLFREQECMKTMLRVAPPRFYNLATISNSVKLFTPPLYILRAWTAKTSMGGGISMPTNSSDAYGYTDFHYPQIEVKFGTTSLMMSLDFGQTGHESVNPSDTTISTTVNDITYSMEILVRKDFNTSAQQPTFCLYRKIKDENGVYLDPLRIACVNRNNPEINNTVLQRRAITYADSTNTYNSARIVLRYLGYFGANAVDNSCLSDDSCTPELKLDNVDAAVPTCDTSVEWNKVCAQREECNKLNNECIQNEIDMQTAKNNGQITDSFMAVRRYCTGSLLQLCNNKKGINLIDDSASMIDQNPGDTPSNPNSYGWFNEICISSGFESKLQKVLAHKMPDGTRGKCYISSLSPYLQDGLSSTNCDEGGKAPNCLCQIDTGADPDAGDEVRTQTPHEAGMCVDIPLPQTCPAIDYNTVPPTAVGYDSTDPEFVLSSLNIPPTVGYGSINEITGVVQFAHKIRTLTTTYGHAEFPTGIFGMNSIEGTCNGFWKKRTLSGVSVPPKLSCLNNAGTAAWSTSVTNACIRYTCPAIITTGPGEDGNYQGDYGSLETGENKGLSNGFATWQSFTKSTDFLEAVTSSEGCIAGFHRHNSSPVTVNGVVTEYSGGTFPKRSCNQLGTWSTSDMTHPCERTSCTLVNPRIPGKNANGTSNGIAASADSAAWDAWSDSGGATYPSVNASRSTIRIQSESIATGTCNNDLGFFKVGQTSNNAATGTAPTRECDSLGNWSAPINPCTTRCDAITTANSSSGNAYWDQVMDVPLNGEMPGVMTTTSGSNGCLTGYKPYPYPPLKDEYGNVLTLADSGPYRTDSGSNHSLTTIPRDVTLDTRAATVPKRVCQSIIVVGGSANVWTTPSSSCINSCPGATVDTRIGVGKTQHPSSSGTLTIDWPTTPFGETAYVTNPGGYSTNSAPPTTFVSQQSAANYDDTRATGYYALSRVCNSNGSWGPVVVQCASNGGTINASNANYDTTTHTVPVGSSPTTSACISGYYRGNENVSPISNYTCQYKDSANKIDETHYVIVTDASAKPCEQYCQITTSTFTNRGSTTSSYPTNIGGVNTKLVSIGSSLTLACKANYGSVIIGGSNTPFANCGRSPSSRSPNGPILSCGAGASISFSNDCSACRDCDSNSALVANTVGVGSGDAGPDQSWIAANSTTVRGYSSGQENCDDQYSDLNIQTGLMDYCANTMFDVNHNQCIRMGFFTDWSCHTCTGGCTQHTDLNASVRLQCIDGVFIPQSSTTCSSIVTDHDYRCRSY